jgi:NAD(P)-dependent dehydrogenase (short-subunit alcohol dehydrogenase family)
MTLSGQTALVTGATSGIGAETACAFAAAGARVVLVGRSAKRLESVGARIAAAGGEALPLQADLAEPGAEDQVAAQVRAGVGSLDAMVHSAGVYRRGPIDQSPLADLDDQWRVNARAPYALTKALLPLLGSGARLVFVTSTAGLTALRDRASYCATKAAADMMMRSLALELAPRGVRVNGVAPGFIATPMNERLREDPAFVAGIEALTPAGRLGLPEEVAAAALFLVSDAAQFVCGETIRVSGGYPALPMVHAKGETTADAAGRES